MKFTIGSFAVRDTRILLTFVWRIKVKNNHEDEQEN